MKVSEKIIERLRRNNIPFFANDNISDWLIHGELDELKTEVEANVHTLLSSLVIDVDNDHNTKGTARRVAKMYVDEVFKGRYLKRPTITVFPNAKHFDELYSLGPISVKSVCSHHFVEIEGQCWVGVYPGTSVVGISKIARIVDWVCRRPHIQEEMVIILADELEKIMAPQGLGVVIKAKHHCMTWRGVEEEQTEMVSSVMRGGLRDDPALKAEFFNLIKAQGFTYS
jgi:GTP cyclohydrolase I